MTQLVGHITNLSNLVQDWAYAVDEQHTFAPLPVAGIILRQRNDEAVGGNKLAQYSTDLFQEFIQQ